MNAVNWDITIQVSFPHKCGQLVSCRVLNVVVTTFFPDISSFVVGYLPWSLSTKEMITFCTTFPRWLSSNLPRCFPDETQLLGNYHQFVIIFPCPRPIDPHTYLTVRPSLGSLISLGKAHGPTLLLGSFIPTHTFSLPYVRFVIDWALLIISHSFVVFNDRWVLGNQK